LQKYPWATIPERKSDFNSVNSKDIMKESLDIEELNSIDLRELHFRLSNRKRLSVRNKPEKVSAVD